MIHSSYSHLPYSLILDLSRTTPTSPLPFSPFTLVHFFPFQPLLLPSRPPQLPVLEALTDSALRPRHWEEIDAALGQPLPRAFTLAHVDQRRLHEHAHTLQQVAHTAQLQREMENRLSQVSVAAAALTSMDWSVSINAHMLDRQRELITFCLF